MTHTSTDQERAEFEARFKHLDLTQEPDSWGAPRYKHDAISLAWEAWQTARRAQVVLVPQGWKLVQIELLERIQESLGSFVSDQGWSQSDMDTADALDGLLARDLDEDTDPDDEAFDDFAEDVDDSECASCSGTGEGMYDGQSCVVCRGKGFL